jgi:ATP-dependent RNA helicase DHX29
MLRVALTETVLQIKTLQLGAAEYVLSRAPDPPAPEALRDALNTLTDVGALDAAGDLTSLGRHLSRLPVDVRAGKIIVFGAVLGCLRSALTIAAYLSSKSPFVAPLGERDAADRVRHALAAPGAAGIAAGQRSDHLVVVAAYDAWRAACVSGGTRGGADHCRRHYLCPVTLAALHGTMRRAWIGGWQIIHAAAPVSCRLVQICAISLQSCSPRRVFWVT